MSTICVLSSGLAEHVQSIQWWWEPKLDNAAVLSSWAILVDFNQSAKKGDILAAHGACISCLWSVAVSADIGDGGQQVDFESAWSSWTSLS